MDLKRGRGSRLLGRLHAHGTGHVRIGEGAVIDGRWAPVEFHALAGAVIEIGDGAYVGPGASIEALGEVRVGAGARLEPLCKLLDSNFHPLTGDRTRRPAPVPVHVGDGAVIGACAMVLPGARVPAGARVAPGAVVTGGKRQGPEEEMPRARRGLLARAARAARERLVAAVSLRGCDLEGRVHAGGRVVVDRGGPIVIGEDVLFLGGPVPTELATAPGARLVVGAGTNLNYGVTLEAHAAVTVGRACQIASFVHLCDREGARCAPIVVEDGVWLAHGSSVGPGVRIGAGAVVAARSVVRADVPPAHLAHGNPARCIPLALFERGGDARPPGPRALD